MKRALIIAFSVVWCVWFASADAAWQYGRIAEIKESSSSYTKAWVGDKPVTEDVTTYRIAVQVGKALLIAAYDITEQQPQPPPDWGKGYAVKVQTSGDSLSLWSVTGQRRLHIKQRKTGGKPMDPLTAEEKQRLDEMDAPLQSLIGLSSDASSNAKSGSAKAVAQHMPEPAQQTSAPPAASPTVIVNVRSTPYLSEVLVDGNSMGYTPASITLATGKHTFRIEKPGYKAWTKEITITTGSDRALEATLEKK